MNNSHLIWLITTEWLTKNVNIMYYMYFRHFLFVAVFNMRGLFNYYNKLKWSNFCIFYGLNQKAESQQLIRYHLKTKNGLPLSLSFLQYLSVTQNPNLLNQILCEFAAMFCFESPFGICVLSIFLFFIDFMVTAIELWQV